MVFVCFLITMILSIDEVRAAALSVFYPAFFATGFMRILIYWIGLPLPRRRKKSPSVSKGERSNRYYFPDSPTSSFFSLRCFNISQGMSTTAITAKEIKA